MFVFGPHSSSPWSREGRRPRCRTGWTDRRWTGHHRWQAGGGVGRARPAAHNLDGWSFLLDGEDGEKRIVTIPVEHMLSQQREQGSRDRRANADAPESSDPSGLIDTEQRDLARAAVGW